MDLAISKIARILNRQPTDIASFEMSAKNKAFAPSASDFKNKLSEMFPAPPNNGPSKIHQENDDDTSAQCCDTPFVKGFFVIFGGVVGFWGGYSVGQYLFQHSGWIGVAASIGVFLGWFFVSCGYGYYHSRHNKAADEKDGVVVIDPINRASSQPALFNMTDNKAIQKNKKNLPVTSKSLSDLYTLHRT